MVIMYGLSCAAGSSIVKGILVLCGLSCAAGSSIVKGIVSTVWALLCSWWLYSKG